MCSQQVCRSEGIPGLRPTRSFSNEKTQPLQGKPRQPASRVESLATFSDPRPVCLGGNPGDTVAKENNLFPIEICQHQCLHETQHKQRQLRTKYRCLLWNHPSLPSTIHPFSLLHPSSSFHPSIYHPSFLASNYHPFIFPPPPYP